MDDNDGEFFGLVLIMCITIGFSGKRVVNRAALKRIKKRSAVRETLTFEHVIEELGEGDFRQSFRMSKRCFVDLLRAVRPAIEKSASMGALSGRRTIPPETRLAITLRLLAGASYVDMRLAFRVGRSTVYHIFHETVEAIDNTFSLKGLPTCPERLNEIATKFRLSRSFKNPLPFCVGAVDGIAFPIQKPSDTKRPAAYFTRKGFYAIPVQALCDAEYRFLSFSARVVGSTHDSLAHSVSGLGEHMSGGRLPYPFWIAGDEAYTCTRSLIVPYSISDCGPAESNFNFCLSSYRVHIEQAFGQLVARWGTLKKGVRFDLTKNVRTIKVCMKLHNLCLDYYDRDFTSHMHETDQTSILEEAQDWVQAFRRSGSNTLSSNASVGYETFTSSRRNELLEIVRRSNVTRQNITGSV